MPLQIAPIPAHLSGETFLPTPSAAQPLPDHLLLDTCGGRVRVEWDPQAPVTPLGQLVFFTQFLEASGRFDLWVKDCPWTYTSPNAPAVRDVCGPVLLSVLAGHYRYAHLSALRGDRVNAPLLGMRQVVCEDSVRRALAKGHGEAAVEAAVADWLQRHLRESYGPLLGGAWILDIDSTIKTIYGHQEGAEVGCNPHKHGRPSHVYHTYLIGGVRVVLDVEVQPGKQTAAHHALPGLWQFWETLPAAHRPYLLRGDCAFGQEGVLVAAETRRQDYWFQLRLTRRPKDLIQQMEREGQWPDAGPGWQGRAGQLRLQGWSRTRRVIVLRRPLKTSPAAAPAAQQWLSWPEPFVTTAPAYEYAVLVTSLKLEVLALAQLYRDRGDAENNFDELKNQWGWAGFTTQDLYRCQVMARHIALIYNWWSTFVRLADPSRRREAITSRPLLLHAVARQTTHAGQTVVHVTPLHAEEPKIRPMLTALSQFLAGLKATAEQLTCGQRWCRILSRIFRPLLGEVDLPMPSWVAATG
jgi:Transposase DDE domain group 1